MKRISVFGFLVFLLSGVCWLAVAGGPGPATISAAGYKKQVQTEVKLVQEMLAKGTVDGKTNKKTRGVAMLIAGYATLSKEGATKNAALRDSALKLIAAMDKGNIAEAKAIAGKLSTEDKREASAKPQALSKFVEFDVVMRLFSRLGLGLERELDEMMELKSFTSDHFDKLTVLGYRLATIGELSTHFVLEKDEGKKTRKSWLQFASDLRGNSFTLVESAKARKEGDVAKSLERISVSCRKCHEIFRDAE